MSGGGSMIAMRSAISSQWAIMASCTAFTPSRSMAPFWYAAMTSGTQIMVISSIVSRPPKPVRSATSPT